MGILQQATGTFNGNGNFSVALPAASSASNRVVVFIGGNTTVATPSGWTLRTSQVNFMGHYLWDRAGGSTSYTFNANGQLNWWIAEIEAGTYISGSGANNTAGADTYFTPNNTPTAGDRIVLASLGSVTSGSVVRTLSGWTNSFVEQSDSCVASADYPMQGVATLEVTANGTTAYSTTGTYSATSSGRSALIASYATSSGSAFTGSLALSGSGTLTFGATPAVPGALGLSGAGTLAFSPTPAIPGSLGLAGDGSLSLASIPTPNGDLALSGSGTLGFSPVPALLSSLALAGEGAVMFTAEPFVPSSLGLGGEGTLSFAADNFSGTLDLSGSGSLAMTGIPFVPSDLALAGDGDLTFASQPFVPAPAGFSGAGSLALAGEPNEVGSLALSGAGALTFAASPVVLGSVDYAGSGTLAGGSGMTLVPLASIASASGWSATGGTVLAVLGDSSDETLITSSGDPSNVLFDGTFGAIVAPSGDFTVRVRAYKASASSGTLTGKLYVNTTLKSTVSAPIPDVLGNVYLVFPAGDLATITAPDWAAGVRITLAATAT